MSRGASGAEGRPYHANDGSFVSGAIPEDKTCGGGTLGRQESKICLCRTQKDISLVVLGFGGKQERGLLFSRPSVSRLNITQAVCGYPGDGPPAMASDASDRS